MKVFWSRCGHGHGNFGDKLTPLFLDYLNLRYEWAPPEKADLIGIGSLIEKIPDNFQGVIWTTGCMFESTRKDLRNAEVLGLRGQLTREQIVSERTGIALGDGGLLCDLFFQSTPKKFKLGIIPHFADQENAIVRRLSAQNPEITVIDVCAPTLDVIQRVGECEHILSSSLHGLILADSLGVPNRWIEFGANTVSGAGFKFRDYYSNFGLQTMQPLHLVGAESLNELLLGLAKYERPGIASVKASLRDSLATLAARFGGTISDTKSLAQLSADEQRAGNERAAWNRQVRCAIELLEKVIPRSEAFLLIDDEQLRSEVTHATAIPFLERDGEYGGAPENDDEAIAEVKRQIEQGTRFIVVAWPAFWWLESYPGLRDYLETNAEVLLQNETFQIFQARPLSR